jgi:hypothetical protein
MTAMTAVTFRQIVPNANLSAYVITYSKGGAGDTIDVSFTDGISTTANGPFLPIKNLTFVALTDDTAGAPDPATYATTVITPSSGTGAGKGLVIGNC